MKKKVWIIIAVITIIVLIVGANIYRTYADRTATVKTETAKLKEMKSTIMTPGTLAMANESTLYQDASKGELKEVLVKEGDSVSKGDPVVTYENKDLEMEKEQNEINIESLYLRINSLDKQEKRLKEKQSDLDDNRGDEEAEEAMEAEIDQVIMDKRMANLDLRQALLQRDRLKQKVSELDVTSDINGIVLEANDESIPESAQMEKPLLRIGSMENLIVEGTLSEYDTLNIEAGQKVTITTDVLPDEKWEAEIIEVGYLPQASAPEANTSAVQYPVSVKFTHPEEVDLKPGFQMILEIETESHDALTLPLEAVQQEGEESFVFIVEDGKAVKRQIETGSSTSKRIEVAKGISQKSEVIVGAPDHLKNKMEVSVE
ncbi:efflux RND transporter periplasmic adaptor subunit [Bacillus sp. RAR_GA_16]|uniref:efflux RND transporter periplasmic adaptor subunit n=1 Tax=Bacillus sp. RAR_GA_16 TaxID=2876774 RepID=UPI001CCFCA17|nr:efflux RND transporter periplasmic adaptor subunit [Bacillus sp. RAR_GA_16]MCA0172467.1 efflux RND transporter periplasmic adaptor subunit [Bacillus sp. RAR_GA_16]